MHKDLNKRFWEIDFIRGIAIIFMIIVHIFIDLYYLAGYSKNYILWIILGRSTATVFIFIVGVSLTLSHSKIKNKSFFKYVDRGLKIFALGLGVTLASFIFLERAFIIFGVLHFIGLSIIIAYPFLKYRYLNLVLGFSLIIIGIYIRNLVFNSNKLLWLGIKTGEFMSIDYFPLLPWFGVVLIGIFVGNTLYKNYNRQFNLPNISEYKPVKFFCFLGRKSLLIYLLHQPFLIIILYLLGFVSLSNLAPF